MNRLLIQYTNNKLIDNIRLCHIDFCDMVITDTKSKLYKIFYDYQFTHIIFIASLLGAEEIQFIQEFGHIIHIYVYKDKPIDIPTHLPIKAVLQHQKEQSYYKCITIPILVNNELFNKSASDKNKEEKIITFLDDIVSIPEELNEYLYPNWTIENIPLLLFNNSNIIHPQNLGVLSEIDKSNILKEHKYYLALTDYYVPEAWACGCTVLCIDDLKTLKPTKFKNDKYFQSHSNFLKVLLSGKN